jgi:hypothetical protein
MVTDNSGTYSERLRVSFSHSMLSRSTEVKSADLMERLQDRLDTLESENMRLRGTFNYIQNEHVDTLQEIEEYEEALRRVKAETERVGGWVCMCVVCVCCVCVATPCIEF